MNYVFNPGYFCTKAQIGIAPATNFGVLTKMFFTAGFSTKTNKLISWHLLLGIGGVGSSKRYYNDFSMSAGGIVLETGFYVKPFKLKKHVFGLNFTTTEHVIYRSDKYREGNRIYAGINVINLNLSYNIKINK